MTDITRVIAVLESGTGLEARVVPEDLSRNAIKNLGTAVAGGQSAAENTKWHNDSLTLLNDLTSESAPHSISGGAETPPSGENVLDTPWYAIFEDHDGDLWVVRFFVSNLSGNNALNGIFIPPADYTDVDGDWVTNLTDDMRPKRSLLVQTRNDITAAQSQAKDHGGGGSPDGDVNVRDEWPHP